MKGWVFGLVLVVGMAGGTAKAQGQVDCSVDGQHVMCSKDAMLKRFAEARTVAVDSMPKSRSGEGELKGAMTRLGKTVVNGAPADITIHLVQDSVDGMDVGAGDSELGTLRMFWTKPGEQEQLIWVERYKGQKDTPWLVVVRGVAQQFQRTLAEK